MNERLRSFMPRFVAVVVYVSAATFLSPSTAAIAAGSSEAKTPPSRGPSNGLASNNDAAKRYRVALGAARDGLYGLAGVAFDEAAALEPVAELVFNAAIAYQRGGFPQVAKARWLTFIAKITPQGGGAPKEGVADQRARTLAQERLSGLKATTPQVSLSADRKAMLMTQLRERLRALSPAADAGPVRYDYMSDDGDALTSASTGDDLPISTFGWTAVGAGALVTIIGVVLKVDAESLLGDLEVDRRPDGVIVSPTQRQAFLTADEATRQQNAGTVALATGGALIGIGVGLLLYDYLSGAGDETSTSGIGVGVRWTSGGASVTAGGKF